VRLALEQNHEGQHGRQGKAGHGRARQGRGGGINRGTFWAQQSSQGPRYCTLPKHATPRGCYLVPNNNVRSQKGRRATSSAGQGGVGVAGRR